jgi:hypothetical protein
MPEWTSSLVDTISTRLQPHSYWGPRLSTSLHNGSGVIHLAVFVEPFLQFVIEGNKTIESRFSTNRCAPYQSVRPGDVLLLKRSSGPVVAIAEVGQVWFYELDASAWRIIKREFGPLLRIDDPEFWRQKSSACFATLMRLERVETIPPVPCNKRDRRGWVVLDRPTPEEQCLTFAEFEGPPCRRPGDPLTKT